jgi:Protein of unknown function (DUF1761)
MHVNYSAILAATVTSFILGGLWYAPFLFGKAWQRLAKIDDATMHSGNKALIFGGAFVLSFITAFVFSMFLGAHPSLKLGVGAGFSAGLCWVATSFGTSYLFERRPLGLFLINGCYFTVQFTLIGLLLSVIP